jgi:hypothetical protein
MHRWQSDATAFALTAVLLLFGCGKKDSGPAPAAQQPGAAPKPAAPTAPATLTDVNLAAADMGGAVEEQTGAYGAGFFGRRLIDGLDEPTWRAPADWWPGGMYNEDYWTKYPQEIVLSFYERRPALVGAVLFVVPEKPTVTVEDPSTAPANVEVWTSMDLAADKFSKAATATLDARGGEQKVTFPAVDAKFVKVRLLSGATKRVVEISEIRVLESVRDGYVPLFAREGGAQRWKGSPREAAQRGLDWLQQAAVDWGPRNQGCFGCHVQAQALMGQAVALEKQYRVSVPAMRALSDLMRKAQTPEGTLGQNHEWTSAGYGGMGFAYAAQATGSSDTAALFKTVDYLLKIQKKDGSMPWEYEDPPIVTGDMVLAANALVSFEWAAAHSKEPKYRQAADSAVAWIAAAQADKTQDLVFKIVALTRSGSQDQKRMAWPLVEELASRQQPDGGWKEAPATNGSNAFSTGQVLYAFKQAGVSIRADMFRRGVDFLLKTQITDPAGVSGFWKAVNTQSQHASDFAPTMWAVIGLAGSYGADPTGTLHVAREHGDTPAAPNLEIILDVSGSMNTKLGDSTRWQTALKVLGEVVGTLPADLKVGLRVYGHRYPSKSAQTCQDTELVVPIVPLDRDRLLQAASTLQPRGETPLVYSVLKTTADLKGAGGGSVILITDGEESCRGNARSAPAEIKKSGVNVTLNIVGFTLTGKTVENELGALAGSTGGRYYGAQDGAELSRALKIAAVQTLPYDVLDASGKVVASAQSGPLERELPAGKYTVRIRALDQVLEAPVAIAADQTSTVMIGVDGGHFVVRK